MIQLTIGPGRRSLPEPLEKVSLPPESTSLRTLLKDLDQSKITWLIDELTSTGKLLCVRTEGGVRIFYDLAGWRLKSMVRYGDVLG